MENTINLQDVYNKLPLKCAAYVESLEVVGLITKGIKGYVPMFDADKEFIKSFNQDHGIDDATMQAMIVGATQGWSSPDINPDNHRKVS